MDASLFLGTEPTSCFQRIESEHGLVRFFTFRLALLVSLDRDTAWADTEPVLTRRLKGRFFTNLKNLRLKTQQMG